MIIDTDIAEVAVEIEGKEYVLTQRTVDVVKKLDSHKDDSPEYRMWLYRLSLVLGDDAVATLFPMGDRENLDRMRMIYLGVMRAFNYHVDGEAGPDFMNTRLEPIADVINLIKTGKLPLIRREE